jgi:hypothetical protein
MRLSALALALALVGCHLLLPHSPEAPAASGDLAARDGGDDSSRDRDGRDAARDLLVDRSSEPPADRNPGDKKTAADQSSVDTKTADQKKPLADHKPDSAPPACSPAALGKACTKDNECPPPMLCGSFVAGRSVCTCPCTPDDSQTPLVNEDSCPGAGTSAGASFCLASAAGPRCVRLCAPTLGSTTCPASVSCTPMGAPLDVKGLSACISPRCTTALSSLCKVYTGVCGPTNTCASGESCEPIGNTGSGRCSKPGPCNVASGICAPRASGGPKAIGAPCTSDEECPANGYCEAELDRLALGFKASGQSCTTHADCCSNQCAANVCTGICRVHSRNGYCTSVACAYAGSLLEAKCAGAAVCSLAYPSGRCLMPCSLSLSQSCRGVAGDQTGDYECRAWSNLVTPEGKAVASGPVCEWGGFLPCATAKTLGLTCDNLGLNPNSTAMTCRKPDTNAPTPSIYDATGFCLDTTTSQP